MSSGAESSVTPVSVGSSGDALDDPSAAEPHAIPETTAMGQGGEVESEWDQSEADPAPGLLSCLPCGVAPGPATATAADSVSSHAAQLCSAREAVRAISAISAANRRDRVGMTTLLYPIAVFVPAQVRRLTTTVPRDGCVLMKGG
jgi:hypothetical protein